MVYKDRWYMFLSSPLACMKKKKKEKEKEIL
jgi:hypothetical protein